jgi:HAD superfamily hydrolase (TIGR01509 family)
MVEGGNADRPCIIPPMTAPIFKNIIWDVDGTLFDTYPAIAGAFRAALNELGADAGLNRIETLAKESLGLCASTLAAEHQLKEEDLDRAFAAQYDAVKYEDQPPFPGVIALCEYVRPVGGKNVIVTHRGREGTDGLLAAHDMAGFFSGCITREDGYPRKPDPSLFAAALTVFGLKPEETLTVGDREIDVQAGRAAGIFSCLFASRAGETAADLVVRDFSELNRFLASGRG